MSGTVVTALVAGALVGCTRQPIDAAIEVDAPLALVDEPVHIRVTGLPAGREIVVSAEAEDWKSRTWRSTATFVADGDGVVDLNRDAPASGSYHGVDGMGLISYLAPPTDDEYGWFAPPEPGRNAEVHLIVTVDGADVARTSVRRVRVAENVIMRGLDATTDAVVGYLFRPAPSTAKRSPVLLLGGSEGGIGLVWEAAVLAARGHPTLALAYFRVPGLPDTLRDIPIEYFATAARSLASEAGGEPSVAVIGYSRGAEAALLLAEHFPDVVRRVVLYTPNEYALGSYPPGGTGWTLNGKAIFGRIPLDHIASPVLAIAGTGDEVLWSTARSANTIVRTLDARGAAGRHEALVYTGAGHDVGTFPYWPRATSPWVHPVSGDEIEMGGTPQADEAARRDGWPKVLAMLAGLSAN